MFKYQIFIFNPNIPIKLEQCELSHKRQFDHTCSGRIAMSYPINVNHSEVLPTKSRYEKENYQVNIGNIYTSGWNIAMPS
jgi:hypothetical protein